MPSLSAIPLISSRALLQPGRDDLFTVDTDDRTFEFDGSSGRVLRRVAHRFDGRRAVSDLAETVRCDGGELASIVALLAEEGVVVDLAATVDAPTPKAFADALRRECRFWSGEILGQPFWKKIVAGEMPETVIFGWGIEAFHYVDSVNEYMAAAAANAHLDHDVRMLIGRHYAEECDHGEIFLQGLANCGFDRDAILSAPPLPGTRALMNCLFELACSDTFAVEAVFNLMQADGESFTKERVNAFYDSLSRLYPFAAPMFEGFRRHALIDVASGHGETVFDRLCLTPGLITPDVARRCVIAVRSLAEHFILHFENIERYYGSADAVVPRRPFDIRAYL